MSTHTETSRGDIIRARSLLDLLEQQLERPDRVAMVSDGIELTFGDLDRITGSIAVRLRERGAGPGVRVGLTLDRSVVAVAALLAILRTGAAYVPLDPSLPSDRLAFMAGDSGIGLLVASPREEVGWLPPEVLVVHVDPVEVLGPTLEADVSGAGWSDLRAVSSRMGADAEAYVIYTSGSTGRPKGCSVSHGNVVALLDAALPLFDVNADDRWLLFHSLSFDFSVWELWGGIATGASCAVVDGDQARDPERLIEVCRTQRVTVLCSVPSAFHRLATRLGKCGDIRYVIFGGEAVRPADVRAAMKQHSGSAIPRFINMYGITETTVHVTFKELSEADLDDGLSPIGVELPHLRVLIADEHGRPVPDGQVGEILVAGAGVASGYVGRDDLTADRFFEFDGVRTYRSGDLGRRLADGELVYLGRLDDQVKLRGFRIELGEVESALREHDLVHDACVAVVGEAPGPVTLEAAVVIEPGASTTAVREFASLRLPAHMVPARVVRMTALPRLSSGKADRAAVARHLAEGRTPADLSAGGEPAPSAEIEPPSLLHLQDLPDAEREEIMIDFLMATWTQALGHGDFEPDDGFFEVGGDSLSIVAVHDVLAERLPQVEVRVVDLFLHPSCRALARHIWSLIASS